MITSQVANQEIFVTAFSIARALKVKAPIAALPIPGHAPLCFHRAKLAAALKGVTPTSITCEMGEAPASRWGKSEPGAIVRYLVVKGYAGNVKTSFRAVPLDVREARKLVTAWASRQRVKKAAPAKVKPTADTFHGDSPEVELESALRSLESFRHQIRRNLFPHASYNCSDRRHFFKWRELKAERNRIYSPLRSICKRDAAIYAEIQALGCKRKPTPAETARRNALLLNRNQLTKQYDVAAKKQARELKAAIKLHGTNFENRPKLVTYESDNTRPSASELVSILQRIESAKRMIAICAQDTGTLAINLPMVAEAQNELAKVRMDIRRTNCRTAYESDLRSVREWAKARPERVAFARHFGSKMAMDSSSRFTLMQEYRDLTGTWVWLDKTGPIGSPTYGWNQTRESFRQEQARKIRDAQNKLRTAARITAEIQTRITRQVAA